MTAHYRQCRDDVAHVLAELLRQRLAFAEQDSERFQGAEQNARVVAGAEAYYRVMYYGSRASWNLRDTHMFDTLRQIMAFRGEGARTPADRPDHGGDSARHRHAGRGAGHVSVWRLTDAERLTMPGARRTVSVMEVQPLTPLIGAEVHGADLLRLTDSAFADIHAAFVAHQVLFFRGEPRLEPIQQIAFARRFGELHRHPAAPHLPAHPEVFVIHAHRDSKVANGNGWHSDVSCDEEPPLGTMLQLHTLPASGGDTLFASMFAAFETLSAALQGFLATLTATHASEHIYRGRYADRGVDDAGRVYPEAVHPVVRTHPDSGRQALYVNPSFTTRINEMEPDESRALLDLLFRHQQRPEFQVRFHWTENAIALWDNRATQHFALWDYWPAERKGHRVTIKGERPFYRPGNPPPASRVRLGGRL